MTRTPDQFCRHDRRLGSAYCQNCQMYEPHGMPESVARSWGCYYIRAPLAFVEGADTLSGEEAKICPRPLGALSGTLLGHEFVETLIRAMQFLTTTSPETGMVLRSSFKIPRRIVETFRGPIWLEGAVTAGLLHVIVACSTLECAPRAHRPAPSFSYSPSTHRPGPLLFSPPA
ncbi:hypothetical protein FB451DRAFT_1282823 [Mycena latifolia]|nr:hypothetical protein FB451DRAFT_1282823 [Mycena latifolia]